MTEWISVKDRLPENQKGFLMHSVLMAYRVEDDGAFIDYEVAFKYGKFYAFCCIDGEFGVITNVTHWQPLPEPPKD